MKESEKNCDWDFTSIFKNEDERIEAISSFNEYIKEIKDFQGKLNNLETVKEYYDIKVKACKLHIKIYAYAMFKYHQNMGNSENSKLIFL